VEHTRLGLSSRDRSDSSRIRAALALTRGTFRLDVTLDLPSAGISALWGPSGSGKTTCLRAVAGLERAEGHVHVGGECWQDDERRVFVPTHRRAVGLVFQDASLFTHLTVGGNLEYGRKRARSAPTTAEVRSLVEMLDLGDLLRRRPDALSGGERQRVAIARALCANPRLLLMDEPLAGVDATRKAEIVPYLERLRDELSIPILYVSHALDEVTRLAGRIVVLEAGRVTASGPAEEILVRLDLPLAHTEDGGVVVDGRIGAHDEIDALTRVDFAGGFLWVGHATQPIGSRVRVRVRARDVSLARDPPGLSSILNILSARVVELSDGGPDRVSVRLAVGVENAPLLARITRRSRDALGLAPGVAVHAMVKSAALVG
jgi:molybdate transport system ATP-binding protein